MVAQTSACELAAKMEHPATLIVAADQVCVYGLRYGEARILVAGYRSGGAWWMGQFREDPGFMTPWHVHPNMDQQLFVLDGVLSF
jgi:hypothetical protein